MPSPSARRTVLATPDRVWAALADFGRIVEWAPTVDHSESMTAPPVGLGSARRVQVGRLTLIETITEFVEAEALAYTLEGLPPFIGAASNRWQLEPAGTDRTTITLTADLARGPRPPMALPTAVLAAIVARGSRGMLDGLADHLEHAAVSAAP